MQLDIVGKSLGEASSVISDADLSFRVVERDGVSHAVTQDVRFGRINLYLAQGKVIKYTEG